MKVSVIVPAYNAEKSIARCIASITAQSYANLELIVVNDGSTDGTKKRIEEQAAADPRILLVDQSNSGTQVARQSGISKASGEAILHLDSDDYLEHNAVELLVKEMQASGADMVIANYFQHRNGIKRLMTNEIPENSGELEILRYLLMGKLSIYIWGRLVRKNLFENLNIPITRAYSEDVLTNFFIFCTHKVKLAQIKEPIVNYIIHDTNISYSKNKWVVEGFYSEFEIVEALLEEKGYTNKLHEEIAHHKALMWIGYCRKGGARSQDPAYRKQFYKQIYPVAKKYLPIHFRLEMYLYKQNNFIGRQYTKFMFWSYKNLFLHKILKSN